MAPYVTTGTINNEMEGLASDIADRAASEMNLNQLTWLYYHWHPTHHKGFYNSAKCFCQDKCQSQLNKYGNNSGKCHLSLFLEIRYSEESSQVKKMTSNFALVKQLARALGTDEDSTLLVVILITLAASFLLNTFVLLPAFAISYLITFNLCRPSIFIILLVLFYQVGIQKRLVDRWHIGFSQKIESMVWVEEMEEEEEEDEERMDWPYWLLIEYSILILWFLPAEFNCRSQVPFGQESNISRNTLW